MRVTLQTDGFQFDVAASETVLDAARRAGVELPHACRGGRCGLCAARLVSGEIVYPDGPPAAAELRAIEPDAVLLCRARAVSDLVLDVRPLRSRGAPGIRRLPARVATIERLGPELAKVWLRLPRAEPFAFTAGQYLDVVLDDGVRRSYSIASPPHDVDLIELHLRRGAAGGRGAALFDALELRQLWEIEGPRGTFVYADPRDAAVVRPLILIAGGTGFAPVKSILRHVLDGGSERPLELYWGARTPADLYDHEWLLGAAQEHAQLRYVPVLSESSEPLPPGMRGGLIDRAVTADHPDLSGVDVYAAGPPAMLVVLRAALAAHGLLPERFYSDLP